MFGDWLIEQQRRLARRGLKDVRAKLTATAPPGAARMLSDAFAGFDRDWEVELPPDVGARHGQDPGVVRHDRRSGWLVVRGHGATRACAPTTILIQARRSCLRPCTAKCSAAFDVRKVPTSSGTTAADQAVVARFQDPVHRGARNRVDCGRGEQDRGGGPQGPS